MSQGSLSGGAQDGSAEGGGDPEAGLLLETVQQRGHGRDQASLARLEKYAEQAHCGQMKRGGHCTPFRLVHEHQIGPSSKARESAAISPA